MTVAKVRIDFLDKDDHVLSRIVQNLAFIELSKLGTPSFEGFSIGDQIEFGSAAGYCDLLVYRKEIWMYCPLDELKEKLKAANKPLDLIKWRRAELISIGNDGTFVIQIRSNGDYLVVHHSRVRKIQ